MTKYQGDFIVNYMSGRGVIYYDNGNPQYIGDLSNDVADGKGTFYHKNGQKHWSGKFWKGKKHGRVARKSFFLIKCRV